MYYVVGSSSHVANKTQDFAGDFPCIDKPYILPALTEWRSSPKHEEPYTRICERNLDDQAVKLRMYKLICKSFTKKGIGLDRDSYVSSPTP